MSEDENFPLTSNAATTTMTTIEKWIREKFSVMLLCKINSTSKSVYEERDSKVYSLSHTQQLTTPFLSRTLVLFLISLNIFSIEFWVLYNSTQRAEREQNLKMTKSYCCCIMLCMIARGTPQLWWSGEHDDDGGKWVCVSNLFSNYT
jgi:uncharacterized membrane protein